MRVLHRQNKICLNGIRVCIENKTSEETPNKLLLVLIRWCFVFGVLSAALRVAKGIACVLACGAPRMTFILVLVIRFGFSVCWESVGSSVASR